MNILTKSLLACAFATASASASHADVIVDWTGTGGSIVTSNVNIAQTSDFSVVGGFQSPASDGSDPSGYPGSAMSPDFYAAIGGTTPAFSIFNGGSNDLLGRIQDTGPDGGDFSSMIAWDFGGGTFEDAALTGFGAFGAASDAEHRILFQDKAGDWWASTAYSGGGTTITADLETWFAYTPHVGGVAMIDITGVSGATLDFSGTQFVGYYQEFTTAGGGGVFSVDFQGNGTPGGAVPEPSSIAILGLMSLGVLRRKRA